MACGITVGPVFGLGSPINQIRVVGTFTECEPDVEGDSILVQLQCVGHDETEGPIAASTDSSGNWSVIFNERQCECGSDTIITAFCATEPSCNSGPVVRKINCVDCPEVNFFGADDVGLPEVSAACDADGSAVVTMNFEIINGTPEDVLVQVSCGQGGLPVSGNLTPVPAGVSVDIVSKCRYDPAVAPNPVPKIEFQNPDGSPQGCPAVPLDVPTLPDCAGCPTSVSVEVRNAQGELVDPDVLQCLPDGDYTLEVVFPTIFPGMIVGWSIGSEIQGTGQTFTTSLDPGQSQDISVSVSKDGCAAPSAAVELVGCADNCPESTSIEVKNPSGDLVDLQAGCLPPGDYALSVTPAVPSGTHTWVVGGNVQSTNQGQTLVGLQSGQTVEVSVSKNIPGCTPSNASLNLVGCETETPPGNGSGGGNWDWLWELFNCNTLLIAAISALVMGGLTVVLGVCTGIWQITLAGGITAFVGALLLVAWAKWCRSTTSCDLMGTIRCLLSWLVAIATVGGLLAALVSWVFDLAGFVCAGAALGSGAGWGLALALITDTMAVRNCSITPCLLPLPNSAPENVGAEQ